MGEEVNNKMWGESPTERIIIMTKVEHKVSNEEKEELFKGGGVLIDHFYEMTVMVRPECPRTEREKHPNEYTLFFPANMAIVSKGKFRRMTEILEDDLNHAVHDEDSDEDDLSNIFRIEFEERNFSGRVRKEDVGNSEQVPVPFVVPKVALSAKLENLHKDLFKIFTQVGVKALTDDFGRSPILDADYHVSDFDYE